MAGWIKTNTLPGMSHVDIKTRFIDYFELQMQFTPIIYKLYTVILSNIRKQCERQAYYGVTQYINKIEVCEGQVVPVVDHSKSGQGDF